MFDVIFDLVSLFTERGASNVAGEISIIHTCWKADRFGASLIKSSEEKKRKKEERKRFDRNRKRKRERTREIGKEGKEKKEGKNKVVPGVSGTRQR